MGEKDLPAIDLAVFIAGIGTMAVEIGGARIIAPYLGNTIYTWASVIGLVLASLGLGYYLGGIRADRYDDRKHFSSIIFFAAVWTIVIPLLGVIISPFAVVLDPPLASLLAGFMLVPASIFYGMVTPYAIKLTSKAEEPGKGAGRIFALSTVGSIIGALGTGFLLIPNLAITHVFIFAALMMIIAGWNISRRGDSIVLEGMVFMGFVLLVLQTAFPSSVEGEVVYRGESLYHFIQVIDTDIQNQSARVLILDRMLSSAEDEDGSPVFQYVIKSRLGYQLVEYPDRILVIGVAAGTQIEDLKAHFSDAVVDGVEIDEKTVDIGKSYFSLDDERTNIIIEDARRYLRKTDKRYELVLLDAFRGQSIPPHLSTREFLTELKQKMDGDGVVIINIISAVEGGRSPIFRYVYTTFSSVFENVIVMPVGEDEEKIQNIVLIATDKDVEEFVEANSEHIYHGKIERTAELTDELNPIEVYVTR